MARFQYVILSRAAPGREDEFVAWYRDRHLADVCRMPGVVGGKLYRMQQEDRLNEPVLAWISSGSTNSTRHRNGR